MTTRPFDWTDLLGQHRTIAIHTPILEWAGDYHAAALFEELVWRWNAAGRQSFTVTDAELMAKLYMTRGALRGARARLVELGAVETIKRGIPPVLHYTVNPRAVTASVEPTSVRNSPNDDAKSAQRKAETEPTYIPESLQSGQQSNGIRATSNGDVGADTPPVPNASPVRPTVPKPKRQPSPLTPSELALRDAILAACGWGWDVLAKPDRVNVTGLARRLATAGRTSADVQAGAAHYARTWPGNTGQKPRVAQLETAIGAATVPPDMSTRSDALRAALAEVARQAATPQPQTADCPF